MIVLAHRDEIYSFVLSSLPILAAAAPKCVVCGDGEQHPLPVSDMRFCRKSHRGIVYSVCKLCKGVPCTRLNDKNIYHFFRLYRLGIGYGVDNGFSADIFYLANNFLRFSNRVSTEYAFADIIGRISTPLAFSSRISAIAFESVQNEPQRAKPAQLFHQLPPL